LVKASLLALSAGTVLKSCDAAVPDISPFKAVDGR
jgi:hypothetical protein